MKQISFVSFLSLIVFSLPLTAEERPLIVNADPQWHIDYKDQGIHFFTMTRPRGEEVLLMFSKWPAPGGEDQIPVFVKQMADGFMDKMNDNIIPLVSKDAYELETISGAEFSGQAAVFKTTVGTYQTMFMVSDGDGIWNGQFSGSKSMWSEAKAVLEKLQRTK